MFRSPMMLAGRPWGHARTGLRICTPLQVRAHSHGHSQGHSHSHGPSQLIGPGGFKNPGVRITWIGLGVNVGMAIGKGIGGVVFHSQSLVADAVHALADMVSDVLTLATIRYTRKPPSKYFPDGYGRVEAMGTLGVSTLLLYAGATMGLSSFTTMSESLFGHMQWVEWLSMLGHSHSHGHGDGGPQLADWNAAWIALGSIVIKEALFQVTYSIGKKTNSTVLIANAWHHRVDSLASVVAAVSIAGGQLFGVCWLDPLGSIIVSGMIFNAGWQPAKSSFFQLIGCNKDIMQSEIASEFITKARDTLKSIDSGYDLSDYRLVPHGTTYAAYVHLKQAKIGATDQPKLLQDADEVAHELQDRLTASNTDLKHVYVTVGVTNERD